MTRFVVVALTAAFVGGANAAPPLKSETATNRDIRASIVYPEPSPNGSRSS